LGGGNSGHVRTNGTNELTIMQRDDQDQRRNGKRVPRRPVRRSLSRISETAAAGAVTAVAVPFFRFENKRRGQPKKIKTMRRSIPIFFPSSGVKELAVRPTHVVSRRLGKGGKGSVETEWMDGSILFFLGRCDTLPRRVFFPLWW
jgi:hypothetical protein